MIIDYILQTLQRFFGAIAYIMPNVTLSDIPYIGVTIRSTLVTVIGYWKAFMDTFPYAYVLWYVFLGLVAFELLMLTIKFILGSRTPVNHN